MNEIGDSRVDLHLISAVRSALSNRLLGNQVSSFFDADQLYIPANSLSGEWSERNNVVLSSDKNLAPNLVSHPGLPVATNAIVLIGSQCCCPSVIMIWGDSPVIIIGDGTHLPISSLYCGDRSTIFIEGQLSCAGDAQLNARNGGRIQVGKNGLWSNKVYIATDDMHAILDKSSGERINPYGGHISIGAHVWLGLESMILGGADIGTDCVVGARSVVKGSVPDGSVVAGSPAKIVREGITWSRDDLPPSI